MSVQDPSEFQDHTQWGAVAVAVCIARTLARQNPLLLRAFVEEADRMEKHLHALERPEWAELLTRFSLVMGRPEQFPLFHPSSA
jgi:hypothetical protein